ncbi:putative ripening-related protein 1 [Bienertia sinuspersici]
MLSFNESLVVALSTGWYDGGGRCGKALEITGNGRSVKAKVVDECDSTKGCGAKEGYQPPCGYNIVAASKAVWRGLGVPQNQWGQLNITWADNA